MADSRKNILIVFGHHDRQSLNGAMLDIAVEALTNEGHHVVVSDLHAMKFNPVLGRHDVIDGPPEGDKFNWPAEVYKAFDENRLAEDIKEEQDKLRSADLLILQFPLYWMGFPAILKGWIDRIFSHGFAFELPNLLLDGGKLKGKKAMLSLTVGGCEARFSNKGVMGDIKQFLWYLQNALFNFSGMDVLPPNIMYGMNSTEEVTCCLDQWRHRLSDIFLEKPLFYFGAKDFTEDGQVLKDDVIDNIVNQSDVAVTVGQHLGLKMPKESLTSSYQVQKY